MKILEIIPEFGLAGAERMVENLTLSLKRLNHEVEVVSLYNYHSGITENLERNNVNVNYLNKKKGLDLSVINRLSKIIKNFCPDIIHTHRYILFYTFLASRIARISCPIVHTVHNEATKENNKIYRKVNNQLFTHFNVLPVALTDNILRSIHNEYPNIKKYIPIVFNGVNTENIKQYKTVYEIGAEFKIMHVGRFHEAKNHAQMVNAFSELKKIIPNAHLYFYGEGHLLEKIKTLVYELGLKDSISFMGVTSNITELYPSYDVFILPSIYEGMPMTLVEAMANGMPILTSNVGGIPDIIKGNVNGILINPNREEISNGLLKLYYDGNLRERLGRQARIDAERYSALTMANEYSKIFNSLIRRNNIN